MESRTYIAIDLKSFYASVECVARGLDPLATNLVVADPSRTEKTICLAVSPSLKSYGISGRARMFEVIEQVNRINGQRRLKAPGRRLLGSSSDNNLVKNDPSVALDYIVAQPRMSLYMKESARVCSVYLKYVSSEDMHVYSVDEVFIDATDYLKLYRTDAHSLAMKMVKDVLSTTGITATAGIGSNLYLAKIAMDIEAKHSAPDKDGVRIAELDEMTYRRKYWTHRPLTDFWRVGKGTAARLEEKGIFTMGDIARCSIGKPYQVRNEELLYKMFGVNAELLIDHAWGWEPCTIKEIKAYKPASNSLSSGQVLKCAYDYAKGRLIVREMTDLLSLDLVEKHLLTDQIVLNIGFGKNGPASLHGSANLGVQTSSTRRIMEAAMSIYDRIVPEDAAIRHVNVTANHVVDETSVNTVQLDLFEDKKDTEKERREQEAILSIRKKFGKNAILKGMNFEEGATAIERNSQIGGHKA